MRDLTVGKESGLIFRFAMPMLIANLFQQTYSLVDLAIIGKSHIGEPGIAAITNSFYLVFSMIALIIGIAIGFNIVIAQYFGAKQIDKVKKTVDTLVVFLLVASIVISIIGVFVSEPLFELIDVPKDIIPLAKSYVNVYFIGALAFFGFHGVSAILRGLGDSKTPLYFMIISSLLNIFLDWLFIIKLKYTIEWAAIATIIAQGVVFIVAVIYLNKTHKIVNISFTRLGFDMEIFRKCLRIGIPTGLQSTFVGLSNMALMWIINPFGEIVTAAFGVANRIDTFAAMPAMNFGAALSTFVGQNLGANKPNRVKKGYHSTLFMTAIIAVIVSSIALIFPETLMKAFTDSPEAIKIGVEYLFIVGGFYILFTTMFTIGGVMRGAGDTLVPMFITLFALWGVRLPLAYFLSRTELGFHGIWIAIPLAWLIGMTFSFIYYKTGRWKRKVVVRHSPTDS